MSVGRSARFALPTWPTTSTLRHQGPDEGSEKPVVTVSGYADIPCCVAPNRADVTVPGDTAGGTASRPAGCFGR